MLQLSTHTDKLDDIHITFADICVDPKTTTSLRSVTGLALLDPEAFSYSILSKERLLGVMLHGPPGTGKVLLVKALAKEAAACALQVSGADFMGNLVGEDEKLVRAVLSLPKKLDPCVISSTRRTRCSGGMAPQSHQSIP
jgi:ATP-dependent 26S proteasome regulatory subunit